ncbi:putative FAD-binding PCMH-type domain-containing protein [Seiridium unicorne]|uniref:FAD-binding PCMH-type domain-containing protein n=1 Tax=Seiridium unicorne TaxID=138068 RepID=A0ABR2UHH0_9PEZI
MEVITAIVAWAISSTCRNIPAGRWLAPLCPMGANETELASRLSLGAHVYSPESDGFTLATSRWSVFDAPGVGIVVVPGVEADVSETVKYANEKGIPFLAVTGGHGAITSTGRMQNGIEIWMDQLTGVEITQDGASARIKGGTLSKAVIDSLWAAGKQTVTGGCECTSLLGPGLGGGHGVLQGRHGLISDQFLSMNIVLADGSLHTIDDNCDLWWAMQGAGHNFGIVTDVTMKIYDVQNRDWTYNLFVFTSDKPVTFFYILQEGVTTVDPAYTKPFQDLGPVSTTTGSGVYPDIPSWVGWDNAAASCQHTGLANMRFPVDLESYNVQAMRKIYDLFESATRETPALNGSFFLVEGYPLQGVRAAPSGLSAFPFRADNLLVAPVISWVPSGSDIAQKAVDLGKDLRQILLNGSGRTELHSYVNYAFGDETPKGWYGKTKGEPVNIIFVMGSPLGTLVDALPHNVSGKADLIVETVFFALGLLSTGLRLWSRKLQRTEIQANDILIITAVLTYTVDLMWLTLVALIKMSILHFYITVFRETMFIRAARGTMCFVIAFWIAAFFSDAFFCIPPKKSWLPEIPGHCGDDTILYIVLASVDLIIDVTVIALPMPILWGLQLPTPKKIGLTFVFGLGLVIILITSVRFKFFSELDPDDFTFTFSNIALLSSLVPLLGITNANLPVMVPAFRKIFNSSVLSSVLRKSEHPSSANDYNQFERLGEPEVPFVNISASRMAPDTSHSGGIGYT